MKKILFVLTLILLIFSCNKDENEPIVTEDFTLEPYIKNLILPDTKTPYSGSYYIHVNFTNKGTSANRELTFSPGGQNMSIWYNPSQSGLGMSVQGVHFRDSESSEELQITFHFNTKQDTTFNICYANYYYSDPWRNIAGANIDFLRPVGSSNPYSFFMYLGTNSPGSYFEIRYIGDHRINGVFRTIWQECCGERSTFDVTGDFSIPDIRYYLK
jgi:hypothetical protein